MSDAMRDIANAVLYEGHMLWPYRPSALKNQQRWTFGGVYPPAYASVTSDRSRVSCECLAAGDAPRFGVEVRFLLEDVERTVGVGEIDDPPGRVEAAVAELEPGLHRLRLTVENTSPWSGDDRNEAMKHTLASAHAVLTVEGGDFLSAIDSPELLSQDGLWPVLVGEPGTTMLASPIILPDYPKVAPESPGDFFDGCEIDQLLVLNILALTDEEKDEIRAGDPRAAAILERTEAMAPEDLMRLHGTWREP